MHSSSGIAINTLRRALAVNVPPVLWGAPGIGKTAQVVRLAQELGWPLFTVLASIRQPDDFAGLPWITDDGVVMVPPDWGKKIAAIEEPSILFLDEISCFVAGTPVWLAPSRASHRLTEEAAAVTAPIESIKPGDQVISLDVPCRVFRTSRVTALIHKEAPADGFVTVTFGHDDTVTCTADHRFWTGSSWVRAAELRAFDVVASLALPGGISTVSTVTQKGNGSSIVYDLTTEPDHSYLVGRQAHVVHNCSAPATQSALLRVVLERVVGDLQLPEDVRIVAAANPPDQAAGGWDLARPLANRFLHIGWPVPSAQEWVRWLFSPASNVHPTAAGVVSAFIVRRPELLLQLPDDEVTGGRAWASPRSWAAAARLLGDLSDTSRALEASLVRGCVGDAVSLEYDAWRDSADQLPDPEDLLRDPASWTPPDERLDLLFATLHGVVAAAVSDLTVDRWTAAWSILERAQGVAADAVISSGAVLAAARGNRMELKAPTMLIGIEGLTRELGEATTCG